MVHMEEHRLDRDETALKAVWPEVLVEDFSDVNWPKLDVDDECVERWVMQHEKIMIRVLTWNLGACAPPSEQEIIASMFPRNK